MSSSLKDARWRLATAKAEAEGRLGWDKMSYEQRELALSQAQALLDQLSTAEIEALAKAWNEQ